MGQNEILESFFSNIVKNFDNKNIFSNVKILDNLSKKFGNKSFNLNYFKSKIIKNNILSLNQINNIEKNVRNIVSKVEKDILNKKNSIKSIKNKLFSILKSSKIKLPTELKFLFFMVVFIFLVYLIIFLPKINVVNFFFNFTFYISVIIFLFHSGNMVIEEGGYKDFFEFIFKVFKNFFKADFYKRFKRRDIFVFLSIIFAFVCKVIFGLGIIYIGFYFIFVFSEFFRMFKSLILDMDENEVKSKIEEKIETNFSDKEEKINIVNNDIENSNEKNKDDDIISII